MGNAYKCDVLGKLVDGVGKPHVDVPVSNGLMLRVMPMINVDKTHIVQGVLCDEAAQKIGAALAKFAATIGK